MKLFFRGVITGAILVMIFTLSLGNKKREKTFSNTYRNRLIKLEDRIAW